MKEGGGGPQEGDGGPKLQGCSDLEEVVLQGWSNAIPAPDWISFVEWLDAINYIELI
jgi:hypothetical protein